MGLEVARGAEENEYVGSVFQYLKGAIRGYIICYWLAALSRFQYLKGAIRGLEQIRAVYPHERFQYLKGAIRGIFTSNGAVKGVHISIPQGCD